MYARTPDLELRPGQSAFFWGARRSGKTTLLKRRFPRSARFDLLDTRLMLEFTRSPGTLADRIRALEPEQRNQPILIDEVQKVPSVVGEVHRLIEEDGRSFVLCGSSTGKLGHGDGNALGSRALRFDLHPLTWPEIPDFDLLRALNRGLVPAHYDSPSAGEALAAYVDDYLREEIFEEGLTRNAPGFARFFDALSLCHGRMVNHSDIARDCGVTSKTVKKYFRILVDTLVGVLVEPFSHRGSRAVITKAPKFYLFDVGVAGHVMGRRIARPAGEDFGRALVHFILMEILAYRAYSSRDFPVRYWRTRSGVECDFVLGTDGATVVEVAGAGRVGRRELRGVRAFAEEHRPRQAFVVCNEGVPRRTEDGIWILPWALFLEGVWGGEVV